YRELALSTDSVTREASWWVARICSAGALLISSRHCQKKSGGSWDGRCLRHACSPRLSVCLQSLAASSRTHWLSTSVALLRVAIALITSAHLPHPLPTRQAIPRGLLHTANMPSACYVSSPRPSLPCFSTDRCYAPLRSA